MNDGLLQLTQQACQAVQESLNSDIVFCIVADRHNKEAALYHCPLDDYVRDPAGFEKSCYLAIEYTAMTRGVFLMPVLMSGETRGLVDDYHFRPNDRQLEEGEIEALFGLAWDFQDGVDAVRLPAARRPSGELVYDNMQVLEGQVEFTENAPGYGLYIRLLQP